MEARKRELGINLHAMPGMTDEDYLKTVADLGFSAVFDMARDTRRMTQLAYLCAAAGLRFETLHAPFSGINSIWLPGETGDEMLARLTDCVDKCGIVDAPIAVIHLSSGENPPELTDLGRGRFSDLVEYAMKKGVKLAFENQRKFFNLSWALETFGPETGVGFCWDCGHEGCFTPGEELMPRFGHRLICTHIHDNMGIYNEDLHLLPFDGKLDFDRVARQLREVSWQGSVMLEVIAKNSDRYTDLTPERYLSRVAERANRLAEMI